ncbi:hypothetical protein [Pectobacterium cacticida]|uniref:hypothetical protein n=1 Tax=Pectobacterium cacticida TaxID=69221 RepID=UPI002FF1CA4C
MSAPAHDRLLLVSLLTLAMAAFITILTEALPQMAQGWAVSEAWVDCESSDFRLATFYKHPTASSSV